MRSLSDPIVIAIPLISCVVVLDRLSKVFFLNLLSLGESIPVIPRFLYFTLVHNTGIAFGLFKNQGILFIGVSAGAVLFFSWMLFFQRDRAFANRLSTVAIALIISGALGNLIDRLQYGFVVDFIDFRFWPVFNIADSAITIGASLFVFSCIRPSAK